MKEKLNPKEEIKNHLKRLKGLSPKGYACFESTEEELFECKECEAVYRLGEEYDCIPY